MSNAALKPNRLLQEKSPYLLQHAYNPVDWYPWSEPAFEAARKENKPIFLSIGYSTCHWCHVMEHESFEDSATAEVMNKYFINIKVDREERPDLDHLYMTTVQLLTGGGGWPMSVWLTPELKPFYGGTYFPPDEKYGRPGFKSLMTEIAQMWEKNRNRVVDSANQITGAVEEAVQAQSRGEKFDFDRNDIFQRANRHFEESFDRIEGGFGQAPKFPMPGNLNFLLYYYGRDKSSQALHMAEFTVRKMAQGGLYDQLGGGFARYSTDPQWIVPHFEKMLYDNAQLISVCVSLFQATKDNYFDELARDAISYVLRDMTHKDGGFYSAEDADSEGKEGTFYLWTIAEIKKVLPTEMSEPFIFHHGLTVDGNFMDPHTSETGKNILVQAHSVESTAKQFGRPLEEMKTRLEQAKQKLFEVRSSRPRPQLDDKVITEWNGLMISALARAGAVFGDPRFTQAASRAAQFIRTQLCDKENHHLYRRWREGEKKIDAFQSDYAFLVQGLLDLFEATGEPADLEWAAELHNEMNQRFWDEQNGGYFMSGAADLLFRVKEDSDNVIPSGNSIAAHNGIRLGRIYTNKIWLETARKTIRAFSKTMKIHPPALIQMLMAADLIEKDPPQVVVVGPAGDLKTKALLRTAHRVFSPGKTVIPVHPGVTQDRLAKINPAFGSMSMLNNQAAANVCINFTCQKPTIDPSELERQLLIR